jgi:site-specific DNA-cytosine methylase
MSTGFAGWNGNYDVKRKVVFNVLYLFCGIGGGARGKQNSGQTWRGMKGEFHTIAGIDCDPNACKDFEYLTGAPAVCLDLFTREDYVAFHGHEPPEGWREATPEDIRKACKGIAPDVIFLSPPCKGLSALLPEGVAASEKYQALNRLVVRGIFLVLEAFSDNLPGIILLENVPRIVTRGAKMLDEVKRMLDYYGFASTGSSHDCGEIGGLGQHRKRYLLIARNVKKVPAFVYKPPVMRVRSIGEVLNPVPLPGDPRGGRMHKLQKLEWKTWVRLAFIPPGGDWRDLQKIEPEDYRLEYLPRGGGPFGVMDWNRPSATVIGSASIKGSNAVSVADPRIGHAPREGAYKVMDWGKPSTTVVGHAKVGTSNGASCVADPRLKERENRHPAVYQVVPWNEPSPCVTGTRFGSGAPAISDPRVGGAGRYTNKYKLLEWDRPATTVTGIADIQAGAASIADPRIPNDNERMENPPIIIGLDGTWHRPLTTLELAILQGLPWRINGRPLQLAGNSDAKWRERIGNMVPPPAAEAIGNSILMALLPSLEGVWVMGDTDIWVSPFTGKNVILPSSTAYEMAS